MTPNDVSIDGQAVVMPVGRVLLIERNDFRGAIKFVHNEIKEDGVYSKYELYERGEKGDFRKIKEGELFRKITKKNLWHNIRSLFFHDIGSKAGRLTLKSFVLMADAWDELHSTVYFWDGDARPDVKVRFAPTPYKEIGEVKLSYPLIRWFSYDEKRERRVVPIDKIWD